MRVIIATFGSRGDFDPFLALASALLSRGHEVVISASANFRDATTGRGLHFVDAGPDFHSIFSQSHDDAKILRAAMRHTERQFDSLINVARGADLIIAGALHFAARTVSEILRVPYRYVIFSPVYLLSQQLPPPGNRALWLPDSLRRILWTMQDREHLRTEPAQFLLRLRRQHKLPPLGNLHFHLLGDSQVVGAFDPILAPIRQTPGRVLVTGYWREKTQGTLPQEVRDFLSRGEAPVYVGFGSVTQKEKTAVLPRILVAAGYRVIAARGWSRDVLHDLSSDSLLVVDELPHDLLLPHTSVVFHHGGAGTTTAAAIAGVPQVVVPQLGDQFYHARRVEELGIGTRLTELHSVEARTLLSALDLARSSTVRERALAFGEGIAAREASGVAAEYLEAVPN